MSGFDVFAQKPLHRRLGLYDGLSVIFMDCPPEFGQLTGSAVFEKISRLSAGQTPPEDQKLGYQFAMVFSAPADALPRLVALKPWLIPDAPVWLAMREEADLTQRAMTKLALDADLLNVSDDRIGPGWVAHKLVMPRVLRPKRGLAPRGVTSLAS